MKRTLILMGATAVVLSIFLLFLIYEKPDPFDENAVRITVCTINAENRYYWNSIQSGIEDAARDYHANISIASFDRFDEDTQLQLLEETGYYHTDGIITIGAPYNEKIGDIIRERVSQGVPVALIDTDMPDSGRSFYIGTDNELAGYIAGQHILEQTGGHAISLVFLSGINDANQSERLKGFQKAMDNGNTLTIFENGTNKVAINTFLEESLSSYPEINSIFCAEATSSGLVGLYLEEHTEYQNLCVIGFDHVPPTPRLVAGNILDGTVIQQTHDMGYLAIEILLEYIQDPDKEHQQIYTDALFVGPKEAGDYITW